MPKNIVIFVICVGRCGSMSLAKACRFEHEPGGINPRVNILEKNIRNNIIWGGVSHFWKDRIKAFKRKFPDAYFLHLVRNGRDNVKSYQNTRFYSEKVHYPYHTKLLPIKGFKQMSRFEKLCWYWRYWNETIEKEIPIRIRIEDTQIPRLNASNQEILTWTKEQEQIFENICGELNRKYGY